MSEIQLSNSTWIEVGNKPSGKAQADRDIERSKSEREKEK